VIIANNYGEVVFMTTRSDNTSLSYTRYNFGVTLLEHKGKNTTTSVGSEYDDFLISLQYRDSREGRCPKFVDHRPDTISDIFYGTPGFWWYPMQYNSFFDPFEDLNSGDRINIPEML